MILYEVFMIETGFLDQELLSLKKFEEYQPSDCVVPASSDDAAEVGPVGKHMVLDGITIRNLDLVPVVGKERDGTLLTRLDSCLTAMGKRTLRQWVISPLLKISAINQRQVAVRELMEFGEASNVRIQLKKVPDLERLISKIHAAGDEKKSKSHPDSRAVMFENNVYSKRKIMDLMTCLDGFKRLMDIINIFRVNTHKIYVYTIPM